MDIRLSENDGRRFDSACAAARSGDRVILTAGTTYYTSGPWGMPNTLTLQDGVTLIATGAKIVLADPTISVNGVLRPDKDLFLLRGGRDVAVEGGEWDANWKANEGWFCSGMRFHGRFTVMNVTIKGLHGSRNSGTPSGAVEVFAISSEGETGDSRVFNVTVHDCDVGSPDSYVSGIYLGGTISTNRRSTIAGCHVHLGPNGQFAYAANYRTDINGCWGEAARGFYNDTGHTIDCSMSECEFIASYAGISLVSAQDNRRELSVVATKITAPRMVEWWESNGARATGGVLVRRCVYVGNLLASTLADHGNLVFSGVDWADSKDKAPFMVQGQGAVPLLLS